MKRDIDRGEGLGRLIGKERQPFGQLRNDQLAAKWDKELVEVREQMAAHKEADRKFLEYGLRLFEFAQTAYSSYLRRSPSKKRQMLNSLLSNCQLKDS